MTYNTGNHIPYGYPYPDTKSNIDPITPDQYDYACLVWRESLTDADVRSLAADYRMGKDIEVSYDGYLEYIRRGLDKKVIATGKKQTSARRRKKS